MATRALIIIAVSPRRALLQPGPAYAQLLSAFALPFFPKVSIVIIIGCLGVIAGNTSDA